MVLIPRWVIRQMPWLLAIAGIYGATQGRFIFNDTHGHVLHGHTTLFITIDLVIAAGGIVYGIARRRRRQHRQMLAALGIEP